MPMLPSTAERSPAHRSLLSLALCVALLSSTGCSSIRKMAINNLAGTLSGAGDIFTSDEDPELVRDALPFALKTFEALLEQSPDNVGLMISTCQGFLMYGYAFVELEAERLELESYRAARDQRDRALKLYLRARGYCFKALEHRLPGLREELMRNPDEAGVDRADLEDLDVLYWTAMSWGAVVSLGLDQPELVVDVPAVRKLFERCLELDPDWERGVLHDAMISVEGLPETMGGSVERARRHFEASLALNDGLRAGTYVTWATSVSLRRQDRQEFESMLRKALAVDAEDEQVRSERLVNLIAQQRAEFLLDQAEDLILEDLPPDDELEGDGEP